MPPLKGKVILDEATTILTDGTIDENKMFLV